MPTAAIATVVPAAPDRDVRPRPRMIGWSAGWHRRDRGERERDEGRQDDDHVAAPDGRGRGPDADQQRDHAGALPGQRGALWLKAGIPGHG